MNRTVWIRRVAAVAVAGLAAVSLVSVFAIVDDVLAVNRVTTEVRTTPASAAAAPTRPISGLKPALRPGNAAPEVAIGELLNGALGQTGLVVMSVDAVSMRPLGSDLRLAEVKVEGRGDLAVAGAVSNWVAVNHEAVRLKSLNATVTPDGEGRLSLVLLMVMA